MQGKKSSSRVSSGSSMHKERKEERRPLPLKRPPGEVGGTGDATTGDMDDARDGADATPEGECENDERIEAAEGGGGGGEDSSGACDEETAGGSGYLPETLQSTSLLLARLQTAMTRAWDPSEPCPLGANSGGSDASDAAAATAAAAGSSSAAWNLAKSKGEHLAAVAQAYANAMGLPPVGNGTGNGVMSVNTSSQDESLVDTFMGSTRRARKWDWVRCCHYAVNPVLAAGSGATNGVEGASPQPAMAPVGIDPSFCHRTLRPGKPGPEGCNLEQVRSFAHPRREGVTK